MEMLNATQFLTSAPNLGGQLSPRPGFPELY